MNGLNMFMDEMAEVVGEEDETTFTCVNSSALIKNWIKKIFSINNKR